MKTMGWVGMALLVSGAAFVGTGVARAQPPEASGTPAGESFGSAGDPGEDAAPVPAADDPTRTAGGALQLFMNSRDYRMMKRLKGVMTERLQARFDHDSAPFNGKRANRLAAFDFTEKDLKAPRQAGRGQATGPATYIATVRSLWEEQGEATEKRTETITIVRREDGLWRIADLAIAAPDRLRFTDTVNGVTTLRMVLRAWHRGDPVAARPNLSEALLRKFDRDGTGSPFATAGGRRHAAYQIVAVAPSGAVATARVRLYDTVAGEPGPIEAQARVLKLVRKGSRWLVDAWD